MQRSGSDTAAHQCCARHTLPSNPCTLCCCYLPLQLWGLLIGAPSAHYWHVMLQRWFAGKAETLHTVLQKVALDQLTFGPLYNLAFMAYTSMVVNGEQHQQRQQHWRQQQHQQQHIWQW